MVMGQDKKSSLFPSYARYPLALVKGEGSRLWDDQGNEYLDFASGLAVTSLGHCPPQVKAALVAQLDELWHVSNLFHIPNQEKLAGLLTANSCADAVFFCNSGAEANEAAIKLARRYNSRVLNNDRYEIITFQQSFHGRTMATLTATGQDKVKDGFLPLLEGFVYAPFNDIASLEGYIKDKTCAIMLEMVQAEGGVIPAKPEFITEVVRLCEKYNLLLIVDEIQTGMGRTGTLFAYEQYGIKPDIITLAKALGSGFPIGAMLGQEKLISAFSAGTHATTFGGTPIATSAAIATVETMLEQKLPERAARISALIFEKLHAELDQNPFVKEIRGAGLLIGIECVQPIAELITEAREHGLLVVPAGLNVIRLLPNLLVSEDDVEKGIQILSSILAGRAAVV
ncbi:MAG: acetylornithine transaminase [Paenibacillaceae bacterium]